MKNYFKEGEYACKCGCGYSTINPKLLDVLNTIREVTASPILISSGCRCVTHNKKVGGAERSQHIYGNAADITSKVLTPRELADLAIKLFPKVVSVGRYKNFTHIDVRPGTPVFWGSN